MCAVSQGTFEYKPPQSDDIPIEFNVAFLKVGLLAVSVPDAHSSVWILMEAWHMKAVSV